MLIFPLLNISGQWNTGGGVNKACALFIRAECLRGQLFYCSTLITSPNTAVAIKHDRIV